MTFTVFEREAQQWDAEVFVVPLVPAPVPKLELPLAWSKSTKNGAFSLAEPVREVATGSPA